MIEQQKSLNLSPYSELYDILIPKDDMLRRFHDEINLDFVYDELMDKYTLNNGRKAEDPSRMFRYLILKIVFDLSDRAVVRRAVTDMLFKYFLDLAPEDTDLINPSSLAKFRSLRLKDSNLLTTLIGRSLSIAKEKGIKFSKAVIVDATHTLARAKIYDPSEYLSSRINKLHKILRELLTDMPDDIPSKPEGAGTDGLLSYARELVAAVRKCVAAMDIPSILNAVELLEEAIEETVTVGYCSCDKDARAGHKSASKPFFGTKEHLAVDEGTGLVTAAVVTSGEKADGGYLGELVEQSRNNGHDTEEVIGDKAYCTTANLELSKQDRNDNPQGGFTLYAEIQRNVSQGLRGETGFIYNKDADAVTCPAGQLSYKKYHREARKDNHSNPQDVFYFNVKKCRNCPLREGCYKEGAKVKTYAMTILPEMHKNQIAFAQTEEFKNKMRRRYKIEAKNADLKQNYGLDEADSFGQEKMTMQTALSIFACNVKRILRLA